MLDGQWIRVWDNWCLRIGAALGGITLPEPDTVQPEGRPGYSVFVTWALLTVVIDHEPKPGIVQVEQSACVPEKGRMPPDEAEVMAGAAVSTNAPFVLPLTLPPVDSMDVHRPLWLPYV